MSEVRKEISKPDYAKKISELKKLPDLIKKTLECEDKVQIIAKELNLNTQQKRKTKTRRKRKR